MDSTARRQRSFDRRPAGSARIEALEARQLQSVSSPSPADGNDYHLILNDQGTDAPAEAVRSVSPGAFLQKPIPGGFQWVDGTPNQVLTTLQGSTFKHSVVEGWSMWPFDFSTHQPIKTGAADEARTRAMARSASERSDLLIIDIEEWRMDIRGSSRETVNESMNRFEDVLKWIRSERPQLKIGVYGYMSLSDNAAIQWAGIEPGLTPGGGWFQDELAYASNSLGEWQATSEYLRPVSKYVDYMFPSLHNSTEDASYWTAEAKSIISDSRRYGKPVIPFIAPYYHSAAGALAGQEVNPQLWQHELSVVRELADGAIIWTDFGHDGSEAWVGPAITASASVGAVAASISTPRLSNAQAPLADNTWDAAVFDQAPSQRIELANDSEHSQFADQLIA